ncbi:hypothetical protein [uncultured Secundilactobacillus sp.]|uniref:hypothetical protein n=1 Tax=uncultured Secundilactobacillus sp. TaxID=2813935 RepID=UPI00338F653D
MDRLEEMIEELGALNERLRQLEDVDYMTAYYKGYSTSGETLEEVKEQMQAIRNRIERLERQIEDSSGETF